MTRLPRRLRPAGALAASAALVLAAGAAAESQRRPVLRVGSTGEGVVASVDRRIHCGRRCTASFRPGARVTLTATPGRGFSFQRWTRGCVGTVPKCLVVVDRSTTARAAFTRDQVVLELVVSGPGVVTSDSGAIRCGSTSTACAATVPAGIPMTLTPTPSGDGKFGVWGGACRQAGVGPCTVVPLADADVAAAFRPAVPSPGPQSLFVTAESPARVVSDPPGIDCPAKCDAVFASGTIVVLRAANLLSWGVHCVGSLPECVIALDDTTGVSASGRTSPPPPAPAPRFGINVSVSGRGSVAGSRIRCGGATGRLLDCEALFSRGSVVLLRAVAERKARFEGWGGFCSGKKPRCSVRVTAAKTVLAAFGR
jgi:hypothetical protein